MIAASAAAEPVARGPQRVIGRAGGRAPGPTLLFVAGLHGNEPSGIAALERVLDTLRRTEVPVRGEVVGLAGNLAALAAGRRYLARDLNRMWSRGEVARVRKGAPDETVPEERELAELAVLLHESIDRASGPVFVLDLHTASSSTPPFVVLGDTLRNRRFARSLPAPIVLGLEEQLLGTLMEYVTGLGHVSLAFEGGRHEDPLSVEHHEAVAWLALVHTGAIEPRDVPDAEKYRRLLERAGGGVPRILEIFHRHPVAADDGFVMLPGYRNFQPVSRGEVLANDQRGPVRSPVRCRVFLPLYQGLGSDGFFLARPVNPLWLGFSKLLRQSGFPALAARLPGVRPHPDLASTLLVRWGPARPLARALFHLLGFRVRTVGPGMKVARRPE